MGDPAIGGRVVLDELKASEIPHGAHIIDSPGVSRLSGHGYAGTVTEEELELVDRTNRKRNL